MKNILTKFLLNTSGNVALTFAILAIPLFGAVGAAIDYSRMVSERSSVVESMDAALLAGVYETQSQISRGKTESNAIESGKSVARDFYTVALSDRQVQPNVSFNPEITVDGGIIRGSGRGQGEVKTSLISVLGITEAAYDVTSVANISAPSFLELHFLIDNSNSMGIGASQSDVATMRNSFMSCAFACHVPTDSIASPTIRNTLPDARSLGVELRIDVVQRAMTELLENLQNQSLSRQIKTAIYTGSNTLVEEQELTENLQSARDSLGDLTLANAWNSGGTSFDHVIGQLENKVGSSGNGFSQAAAKKVVIIITDGVESNFRYTQTNADQYQADPNFKYFAPAFGGPTQNGRGVQAIQGFNPDMCDKLKSQNNVEIYTINLEYVIPNGVIDPKFQEIRDGLKDNIETNLKTCASEEDNFFSANETNEIYDTFDDLVEQLLKEDLTLTQ